MTTPNSPAENPADLPAESSGADPTQPATPPVDWRTAYDEQLAAAIGALTAAARLPRPRLKRQDDGSWIEDHDAAPEQMDWAEFVTLALAGAAANIGGIEAILNGRPGSWEADGVRNLLISTVGYDETDLWRHRTEPIDITLYVDEIAAERAWPRAVTTDYDDAIQEISRRWEAEKATTEPDYAPLTWQYVRNSTGEFEPVDPAAPAWSLDRWREIQHSDPTLAPEWIAAIEAELTGEQLRFDGQLRQEITVARSPEAQAELTRLEAAHDAHMEIFNDLEDRLEAQRKHELTAYGEALKARIETRAATLPGLNVPINITIDTDTYRIGAAQTPLIGLEATLVEAAIMDTPSPADLPGTPLQRLEGTVPDASTDAAARTTEEQD